MGEMFNNRPLTALEKRLREKKLCIACGAKVPIYDRTKKIDVAGHCLYYGKVVKTGERWPFECTECFKARRRLSSPMDGPDFGACRASLTHEFSRRMGASLRGVK